jgi:Fur family ferric uptake transcriptional regulator
MRDTVPARRPRTRDAIDAAEALLAERGARLTRARIDALSTLLASTEALTHHEIARRLPPGRGIDRVTLYRVLEWLTAQGLAHKVAGDDRAWRYSSVHAGHASGHAHFRCNTCGRVVCLDAARVPSIPLPAGFRRREVEVTVTGTCAACAA